MNRGGTIEVLEEILKWIKFDVRFRAIEILRKTLDDDNKKRIYELSDGKSSPEIAFIVKTTPVTVRNYWERWSKMGIMEVHPDYKKRYRRLFSLNELGIDVPIIEEDLMIEEDREND